MVRNSFTKYELLDKAEEATHEWRKTQTEALGVHAFDALFTTVEMSVATEQLQRATEGVFSTVYMDIVVWNYEHDDLACMSEEPPDEDDEWICHEEPEEVVQEQDGSVGFRESARVRERRNAVRARFEKWRNDRREREVLGVFLQTVSAMRSIV